MPAQVLPFKPRTPEPEPIQKIIICPKCNTENDYEMNFCGNCGKALRQQPKSTRQRNTPKTKHTKVPLKTDEDINAMAKVLATPTSGSENKKRIALRNLTLFLLDINIGLRASDLIRLKVSDFFYPDGKAKPSAYIIEKKTGKGREITIFPEIEKLLADYVRNAGLTHDDYLAWSQREHISEKRNADLHGLKIMSPDYWSSVISKAATSLGWSTELYGGHTLRKTFGYNAYRKARAIDRESGATALATICKIFGHSSEAITLIYIGIDKEEVLEVCKLTTEQYDWAYMQALAEELNDEE